MLQIEKPVVSVQWLHKNINSNNLIIFDATIPKVTSNTVSNTKKEIIPNAIFFDLKGVFLDKDGKFPNTFPETSYFEEKAQEIGVNKDSCIVVYDDLGIYSSARVWFLFKTFGFNNIAVLDGGLPEWKNQNLPVEEEFVTKPNKGNFKAEFQSEKVTFTKDVLLNIEKQNYCLADARSKERFYAEVKEPREGLRGGHIPGSCSLPHTELKENGKMKTMSELKDVFKAINPTDKSYMFSCGTGITACILALGLELTGKDNCTIYDGSWTEWGSTLNLPIEK